MKYGVVIPARNEADSILYSIRSLERQTIKPELIVVVDDGSEDNTAILAEKEGAYVVRVKRKSKASATGTPYLAYVFNQGLNVLKEMNLDYLMISGAEAVYPVNYISNLTRRMIKDRVVIASGVVHGEKNTGILSIRGSGRLIHAPWFHKVGFSLPVNYGFETWLLLKALAMGMRIKVYYDVKFYLLRRTSMSPRKAYFYGKAMKALDYPLLYTLGRILKTWFTSGSIYAKSMLQGYLHGAEKYSDIAGIAKYVMIKELVSGNLAAKLT